jgi:hypothetical protein
MIRPIALAFCLFLSLGGVAYASQPAGLYVLVEQVELDAGNEPKWIKILGVFMNEPAFDEDPRADKSVYGPVQGWLKFDLPESKPDLARLEWKDFTTAKGKVVAFGSAYTKWPILGLAIKHFVRQDAAQVESKDYPVDHGMYLLRDDSVPAKKLYDFRKANPAPK